MANELNIALANSGLTVTAQRYQSGAAVGSAISLSEISTSGIYTGNMTGSAGTYQLAFISAGKNVGSGQIVWDGSNEVLTTPSTIRTELDANSTKLANLDATVSSRLATSGYTAPSAAPSVVAIRQELDANSTKLANLDVSVSSRLAASAYTAPTTPPTAAEIATAVEGSLLNESDGQAVLNAIVGAIGNSNVDEIALVAAIRSDLERNGGKLDSIPTTAAPSASAVASATRTELSTELSRIDQNISSRLASSAYTAPSAAPTAAANAAAVRSELSVELGRLDASVSTRATPANIPASDIAAIKAVTDDLDPITERLANVATTNIVGTLLAQSQS